MKHPLQLGKAEMDVLRYVAEHGPVTVREAADHLAEAKGQVRTTVLNSLERLRDKGFLLRRKVEGVYQYATVKPKAQLFRHLLTEFIDAAFGGSQAPLVAYFAEEGSLSPRELELLRKAAARLEPPRT